MDENAIRYLLFFRQHMIRKHQTPSSRPAISYRETVWAYHSDSQDILVDLVSRQFQGRMLWEQARECGMFLWMTDLSALVRKQDVTLYRRRRADMNPESPVREHSSQ